VTTALQPKSVFEEFVDLYGPKGGELAPVRFVREVLGATPDDWQIEILKAYGRKVRQISIESCHGPGKTAVLAWIVVLQSLTKFPQKTACTAPTGGQMYDALFAEVKKWVKRLPSDLQALFEVKSDRIELKGASEESFATFRTARAENPEALQGIHSDWVLLIADEASGVPEPIFEAALGSMSGYSATTILAGNPVRTGGFFYNSHHGDGASNWFRIHVSAIDGPHIQEGSYVSRRTSPEFVNLIIQEYGEDSNPFRVRVLGRPPKTDDDAIIPFEWVEMSLTRDVKPNHLAPRIWGVDVARSGEDLTALAKRQQHILLEPIKTWAALNDTMLAVGVVKSEWDKTPKAEQPVEILVDVIGLGAGVADRLRELGLPARGINVAESPALDGSRFKNLRTELYFAARDWFAKRDCQIMRDEKFIQEITAQKYRVIESSGKVVALPKDDMRKFIHPRRSPDRADAFILTFATTASTAMYGNTGWSAPLKRGLKGIV